MSAGEYKPLVTCIEDVECWMQRRHCSRLYPCVQHQHGAVSWGCMCFHGQQSTVLLLLHWGSDGRLSIFLCVGSREISSKVIPMQCIVLLFLVSANSKMFVKAWWLWLTAAMTHANIGRSWDLLDWADNRQVARDQLQTREVARAENICEMLKIFGET